MELDYEYMILNSVDPDSGVDDCKDCPYKPDCNSQCMEVETIYNPNLKDF